MKTGIMGGTFNPVHMGHVNLARYCRDSAELHRLLIVPTGIPPHKQTTHMPDSAHRTAMLRLAFSDIAAAEISDIELIREGKSYTIDTLLEIKRRYPKDELYLIIGSDMLYTLESWHRAGEIKKLATVLTMPREPGELLRMREHKNTLIKAGWKIELCEGEAFAASSTEIRAGDMSALPHSVADYIAQNGLYGQNAADYPWDFDSYMAFTKQMLSPRRYEHSLNVAGRAEELALIHGADKNMCRIGGILHDLCKEMPIERQLQILTNSVTMTDKLLGSIKELPHVWHGFTAAAMLPGALNIHSRPILNAISFHTTARAAMSDTEMILYLADLTSSERDYPDAKKLRDISNNSLTDGVIFALRYFRENLKTVSELTKEAFSYYLK